MTDELDAALIRLQYVAYTQRRTEPAVADDLEAVIRFASNRTDRRIDPMVITRLEKRAVRAIEENQPTLAKDLAAAVELVGKLTVPKS